MADDSNLAGCFVCRKHRDRGLLMPGGPVAQDELIIVSHIVTPEAMGRQGTTAYLGHLFVEPQDYLLLVELVSLASEHKLLTTLPLPRIFGC